MKEQKKQTRAIIQDVFDRFDMGTYLSVQLVLEDEICKLFGGAAWKDNELCYRLLNDIKFNEGKEYRKIRTQIAKRVIEEYAKAHTPEESNLDPKAYVSSVYDILIWLDSREEE